MRVYLPQCAGILLYLLPLLAKTCCVMKPSHRNDAYGVMFLPQFYPRDMERSQQAACLSSTVSNELRCCAGEAERRFPPYKARLAWHAAALRCGRAATARPLATAPELFHSGVVAEMVVDAQFHSVGGDRNIRLAADRGRVMAVNVRTALPVIVRSLAGNIVCSGVVTIRHCSEVEVLVFRLERPRGAQSVFGTRSDGPTHKRIAVARIERGGWLLTRDSRGAGAQRQTVLPSIMCLDVCIQECDAPFHVKECTIRRIAEAGG